MGKKADGMQKGKKGGKTGKEHAEENTEKKVKEQVKEMKDNIDESGEKETAELQLEEEKEINLEEIIKEKEDKYLRLAAEFDNYRKRTLREKAELIKLGGEEVITVLLPVIDDLDRALESMGNAKDMEAMKKGIELIYGKFRDFLAQKGVREIDAKGADFDTDLHDAVTKIPVTEDKEKGKIVDVIEKGYLLHDKVIRFAKVVLGE